MHNRDKLVTLQCDVQPRQQYSQTSLLIRTKILRIKDLSSKAGSEFVTLRRPYFFQSLKLTERKQSTAKHSWIFWGCLTWLPGLGESAQNLSRSLPGAVGHVFVSNLLFYQLWSFHWHLCTMSVHVAERKGTGYTYRTSYLCRVQICP